MGLQRGEAEKAVSCADPNQPAPFIAIGHLFFETTDQVRAAISTHGREVMVDIKNYTDIQSTFQIGEVLV